MKGIMLKGLVLALKMLGDQLMLVPFPGKRWGQEEAIPSVGLR